MGIDIKDIREGTMDAERTMADATTGAIVSVVGAATDPVGTVRKSVRRLAKRGQPVNRRVERRVNRTADDVTEVTVDVVSGNLAERVALYSIRMLRDRSRKQDVVGDVLFRGLSLFNSALDGTASELGKFQKASEPPARNGERRSSPARRSTATRARATGRSASRTAGRAKSTAKTAAKSSTRSTTTRARRTARKAS